MSLPATLSPIRPLSSSAPPARGRAARAHCRAVAALWRSRRAGPRRDVQVDRRRTAASSIPTSPRTAISRSEAISAPPPPANPNAAKELAAKEAEMQAAQAAARGRGSQGGEDARRHEPEARAVRQDRAARSRRCRTDQSLLYRSNEKGEKVSHGRQRDARREIARTPRSLGTRELRVLSRVRAAPGPFRGRPRVARRAHFLSRLA